jgi:REP-associated tyrosine transposase
MLSPGRDGELSRFMHWLTGTHAQQWHAHRGSSGTGAVYQGRFKAIPVESDSHFLRVCRYVERNALRASLVDDAARWRWSSLWRRANFCDVGRLDPWPISPTSDWLELVNQPQTELEVSAIREAIRRGRPIGCPTWVTDTAKRLSLESSLRPPHRGRTKGLPTPLMEIAT